MVTSIDINGDTDGDILSCHCVNSTYLTVGLFVTYKSDPNCAQNHNESIIYSSESAKASMTTAYHSYKLENLHPFCEYDFIVSTQIEPKNKYEALNSTRFISTGVRTKGILSYNLCCVQMRTVRHYVHSGRFYAGTCAKTLANID